MENAILIHTEIGKIEKWRLKNRETAVTFTQRSWWSNLTTSLPPALGCPQRVPIPGLIAYARLLPTLLRAPQLVDPIAKLPGCIFWIWFFNFWF